MVLFELALALGFAHPDHLLAKLTSQQVTQWVAFYSVRPFGFVRESMLFGTLAAQQHNMNKVRGRDLRWQDFFPIELKRVSRVADSDEAIIALFKAYNLERGYKAEG